MSTAHSFWRTDQQDQDPKRLFGRPGGGHPPPAQLQALAEMNQTPPVDGGRGRARKGKEGSDVDCQWLWYGYYLAG